MVPLFYYNLYYKEIRSKNAGVYKFHFRCPQVLSCRKHSFASPDIFTFTISKCLLVQFQTQFYHNYKYKAFIWQKNVE